MCQFPVTEPPASGVSVYSRLTGPLCSDGDSIPQKKSSQPFLTPCSLPWRRAPSWPLPPLGVGDASQGCGPDDRPSGKRKGRSVLGFLWGDSCSGEKARGPRFKPGKIFREVLKRASPRQKRQGKIGAFEKCQPKNWIILKLLVANACSFDQGILPVCIMSHGVNSHSVS